ncbi:hypothetical protein IWQ62_004843 [Dispira parvispora]|uniref:SAC3/GANP/THP3 conserved domain-containing protein n=1 Tax=Dispira parvispora TaxID=1520584 RepID=A0A9W8E590_9FUNG|nr:hypothetical protein IWQ62_004843 [Dispira parvispora]
MQNTNGPPPGAQDTPWANNTAAPNANQNVFDPLGWYASYAAACYAQNAAHPVVPPMYYPQTSGVPGWPTPTTDMTLPTEGAVAPPGYPYYPPPPTSSVSTTAPEGPPATAATGGKVKAKAKSKAKSKAALDKSSVPLYTSVGPRITQQKKSKAKTNKVPNQQHAKVKAEPKYADLSISAAQPSSATNNSPPTTKGSNTYQEKTTDDFDPAKSTSVAKNWPPDLKEYVTRALKSCQPHEAGQVEEALKDIIMDKIRNNALLLTDWDTEPLPNIGSSLASHKRNSQSEPSLGHVGKGGTKKRVKREDSPLLSPSRSITQGKVSARERAMREKRMQRFQKDAAESGGQGTSTDSSREASGTYAPDFADDVIDWDEYTIVGTCTRLEKQYLRLTSAPDPTTVRPLPVLHKTLELLKQKWRTEKNYPYIRDQFKSLRQDLTVQRIKNDFTVRVYEVHARIALESNDLGEYNLCQTKLKELYQYNLPGHRQEFLAYRILYALHLHKSSEVNAIMMALTPEEKQSRPVQHALQVRTAVATFNYHQLFILFADAPNMNGSIMAHFLERYRVMAMMAICKAYRPTVPVSFVRTELAFPNEQAAVQFLEAHQVVFQDLPGGERGIVCKLSFNGFKDGLAKFSKMDITGQI